MLLEPAPEKKLVALEDRIDRATREGGTSSGQLVEWRQECLALAQLACRSDTGAPDRYQLGRACGNLAAAYLSAGAAEAALRHAERAEALLLSEAGRTDAAALLPGVLQTLASSHAACGKYRRAAEYFNRALVASNEVFGKGHVSSCPVLRGWAHMAVRRNGDYDLAVQLLRKEVEVREAHMGRQPGQQECADLVALLQELAELMLQAAKQADAPEAQVRGGKGAPRRLADPQRATELREEARALLRASVELAQGGEAEVAPLNEEGARMAVKLARACAELEEWEQAEARQPRRPLALAAAYLRALPCLEEAHGMSDARVLQLWGEVAALRLRQGKPEQAADDYAHLLAMQGVLHGEGAAQLIPTAEALCKARVQLRQYSGAHAALRRAHELSCACHGERDKRSTRFAEVLASLQQFLPAEADDEAGAAAALAAPPVAAA